MKKSLAAVALTMTLVSCDPRPDPYERPQEVVRAMANADLSCEGLQVTTASTAPDTAHDPLIKERGVCSVDGEEVVVITFATAQDRDNWVAVGGLIEAVVVGPNWVATSDSDQLLDEVARALNASTAEDRKG